MNDRETFVRAICESPFDSAPRLIFADWLDERGEVELANYIRIPFGNVPWSTVQRTTRELRLRLILGTIRDLVPKTYYLTFAENKELAETDFVTLQAGKIWISQAKTIKIVVRHGFITEIGCWDSWFRRRGAGLFHRHPIVAVQLFGPVTGSYPRPTQGTYVTWSDNPRNFNCVPNRDIFKQLRGIPIGKRNGDRHMLYEDAKAAWLDLSRACVAWGRQKAGLPVLPSSSPDRHLG